MKKINDILLQIKMIPPRYFLPQKMIPQALDALLAITFLNHQYREILLEW